MKLKVINQMSRERLSPGVNKPCIGCLIDSNAGLFKYNRYTNLGHSSHPISAQPPALVQLIIHRVLVMEHGHVLLHPAPDLEVMTALGVEKAIYLHK